jgi:hypothetical protein
VKTFFQSLSADSLFPLIICRPQGHGSEKHSPENHGKDTIPASGTHGRSSVKHESTPNVRDWQIILFVSSENLICFQ